MNDNLHAEHITYIHLYLFSVRILYRRIVAFYPHILHELSREAALSNSACSRKLRIMRHSAVEVEVQTSAKNNYVILTSERD
jgi:hypothetical protein